MRDARFSPGFSLHSTEPETGMLNGEKPPLGEGKGRLMPAACYCCLICLPKKIPKWATTLICLRFLPRRLSHLTFLDKI